MMKELCFWLIVIIAVMGAYIRYLHYNIKELESLYKDLYEKDHQRRKENAEGY